MFVRCVLSVYSVFFLDFVLPFHQDDLLLMKKGGHVVYHGPLGENCDTLVNYFEGQGANQIAIGENPANWMLRVITDETMGDLAERYQQSEDHANLSSRLDAIASSQEADERIVYDKEFAAPQARRQELVNRRLHLIYWRSPAYNLSRLMVSAIIGVIMGSIFIIDRSEENLSEVRMRARLSVIFLSFIIIGITAILAVLPSMTKIRDMFYRHRDSGMYDSTEIGWALGSAEKLFIVVASTIFTVMFLVVSGLGEEAVFGLLGFWVSRTRAHKRDGLSSHHIDHRVSSLSTLPSTPTLDSCLSAW